MRVPDAGVPSVGVVSVGLVSVLLVRVWVADTVTILTPSIDTTPADTRASVVSLACPSSIEPTPRAADVLATSPAIGKPVQFVSVPLDGVPSAGVTNVGDVANTNAPVPVSSLMTPRN